MQPTGPGPDDSDAETQIAGGVAPGFSNSPAPPTPSGPVDDQADAPTRLAGTPLPGAYPPPAAPSLAAPDGYPPPTTPYPQAQGYPTPGPYAAPGGTPQPGYLAPPTPGPYGGAPPAGHGQAPPQSAPAYPSYGQAPGYAPYATPQPGYQPYGAPSPGTPTPPTGGGGNRRGLLIAGSVVGGLVVVLVIVLVVVLAGGGKDKDPTVVASGSATPTVPSAGPSSASVPPASSTPATTPPQTSAGLSPAEQALLAKLDPDEVSDCRAESSQEDAIIEAALLCTATADSRGLYAYSYSDLNALQADSKRYGAGVSTGDGECSDGQDAVTTWDYQDGDTRGDLICAHYPDQEFWMRWYYEDDLLAFFAADYDASALYDWWTDFEAVA